MEILRITARRDGFRRGGIAHPAQPVDHPVDSLTDDQIGAIVAEPMLVVERVTVPDPAPPPGGDDNTGKTRRGKGGIAS